MKTGLFGRLGRIAVALSAVASAFLIFPVAVADAGDLVGSDILTVSGLSNSSPVFAGFFTRQFGKDSERTTYCYDDVATGGYITVYNLMMDLDLCYQATIEVTEGDTDLYMTYQEPWNEDILPPAEAGGLLCSSNNPGAADEICNGCDDGWCVNGSYGVWRNYGYVASGPSDFCITVDAFLCETITTPLVFEDGFETGDFGGWIVQR